MNNETVSDSNDSSTIELITLIALLTVEIPSLLCTLLILIYIFFHWNVMMTKALHHHAIFLLIIVSFLYITLDLPFSISRYHLGYDYFLTPAFCRWWYWTDYTLLSTSLFLATTASIQRHFLIFNSHWFRIKRRRWLLHFAPLIFCMLYPLSIYIILVYLYPCVTTFEKEDTSCNSPCYGYISISYSLDWLLNYVTPAFIIILSNITLICRIIYSRQKLRQRRSNHWKKQKKLFLQLLGFSVLYMFGWGPAIFISMIRAFLLPDLFDEHPLMSNIQNSVYFVCPLQTFICIFAMPEVARFIRNRTIRQQRNTVVIPTSTARQEESLDPRLVLTRMPQ